MRKYHALEVRGRRDSSRCDAESVRVQGEARTPNGYLEFDWCTDDEISLHEEAEEMERWRMTYEGYDFHDDMHQFKKMDREGHQGKAILQKDGSLRESDARNGKKSWLQDHHHLVARHEQW